MTSKTLAFLQWFLIVIFVVIAAAIVALLVVIYQEYPHYIPNFLRTTPETVSAAPQSIPVIVIRTVTLFSPLTPSPAPMASSTPLPGITSTIPPTHTFTAVPTSSYTPEPTATLTPVPTEVPALLTDHTIPSEAYVHGVIGYAQQYSLDCESRSAVDLAAYFGVYIDQMAFQENLPVSDDPEQGFVGYYWGLQGQLPPASYGVHASPIAALLHTYGLAAYDQKGVEWTTIQAEIAAGRPVMVWVIGNTEMGWGTSYTASNGNTTTVAQYEHTVLVTGYSPNTVTLVDGSMVYTRSIDQFLNSWGVLGNQAVMIQ
jgi:uncharacterized protein YvpB